MTDKTSVKPIDEVAIGRVLEANTRVDEGRIQSILDKALLMKGLDLEDVAALSSISDPDLLGQLFAAAKRVKDEIYGKRLVIFAPLYISNLCANECLYCAFRAVNTALKRRALSQDEFGEETRIVINQVEKRFLLVAGESYPGEGF